MFSLKGTVYETIPFVFYCWDWEQFAIVYNTQSHTNLLHANERNVLSIYWE